MLTYFVGLAVAAALGSLVVISRERRQRRYARWANAKSHATIGQNALAAVEARFRLVSFVLDSPDPIPATLRRAVVRDALEDLARLVAIARSRRPGSLVGDWLTQLQLSALWLAPGSSGAMAIAVTSTSSRYEATLRRLRAAAEAEFFATLDELPAPLPQEVLDQVARARARGASVVERARNSGALPGVRKTPEN